MDKAFALARKHSLTNPLNQKEIYDKKYMGSHIIKETLCGCTLQLAVKKRIKIMSPMVCTIQGSQETLRLQLQN